MKKTVFLISLLLAGLSTAAQKIVYIADSTALKRYFGKAAEVVSVSADRKVTTDTRGFIHLPKPEEENTGIPGRPQARFLRNDNAATLRKELSAAALHMNWSAVLTGLARLQFHAFVNPEGRIDSLIYYLVRTDTTRMTGNFLRHDNLGPLEGEDFRAQLENNWLKKLQSFTARPSASSTRTYSGHVFLRAKTKNLEEFLDAQPLNITEINLTDFGLEEFPYQLKRFRNLKNINLKDNYISSATLNRKDFPKLVTISFQNNLLRDDSLRFTGRKGPAAINLTDNHFIRIPKTYRKVRYLYLANNSVSDVTRKDIRKLKKVQFLNLYGNMLTEVSPNITRLKKLKELDLYRNRLTSLPTRITRLKKLETLAVSYNKLKELPAGLEKMKAMKILYSHHNELRALPPLPAHLETLDVGYNQLQEVSARVRPLQKLKSLDYSYNQVKGDLDFLLGLPRIKEIYLLENRYAGTDEEEKYFSRIFSTLVSKGVTVK